MSFRNYSGLKSQRNAALKPTALFSTSFFHQHARKEINLSACATHFSEFNFLYFQFLYHLQVPAS